VRLKTGFNMVWIVRAEGPLFLCASLALLRLHRQRPTLVRWQSGLQTVLVTALALAGLRAIALALGLTVPAANFVVLAAAGVGGAVVWWCRHRARTAA
jgi:hypothetical protein